MLPPLFGQTFRAPPSNLRAEQALLGAVLSNNRALDRCGQLRGEHFADPLNGWLFDKCAARINLGHLTDGVTLHGELANAAEWDLYNNDPSYIAQLLGAMVGILNVTEYAQAIHDGWLRRRAIDIGEQLVNAAFGGDTGITANQIIDGSIDELVKLVDEAKSGGMSLGDAIKAALEATQRAMDAGGPVGLPTGFRCIDERLGGLEDETLTVIAARPGMGKTALGCDIAMNVAARGIPVLMFSLEMSGLQVARRRLAQATRIPAIALKQGRVGVTGASKLVEAARAISPLPIWLEDAAGVPISTIASQARVWRRKHRGQGLVLLDHLHIVRPETGDIRAGATYAVGQVSGGLKRLSKALRLPVITLAQLSRGPEARDDKRPTLADLRQSGDIEQDADSVGFIYRREYYLDKKPEQKTGELEGKYADRITAWEDEKARCAGHAELIWGKVRDGESGTDELRFDGPTTSFSEAS